MGPERKKPYVLIFILVLIACEGEGEPTSTPDLVATEVAVQRAAAATLTAEVPTATNTPTSTLAPTATATSTDTPTAAWTPTFTPSPTVTPAKTPTSTLTPSTTPTLTAMPAVVNTPKPRCRNGQKGWIGFRRQKRCNTKTGDGCGPIEIWIMQPDGSNQTLMCNPKAYEWGLLRDRTSNDGQWRLEVTSRRPDIMRLYTDGRQEMIIVNNRKDWDPVLSADNWWLAWVTNRNANDEIYVKTMDPNDQNQRRLTVNEWEWDKHPTWAPNGRSIAFYTNRANTLTEATRQIWVMDLVNDQGVNLRNISQRPDRVDTDPVWFKWDEILSGP